MSASKIAAFGSYPSSDALNQHSAHLVHWSVDLFHRLSEQTQRNSESESAGLRVNIHHGGLTTLYDFDRSTNRWP